MRFKKFDTGPQHAVATEDIFQLLKKHAGSVTAEEMLAIAANLVGKLIALQDQRVMTPEIAMRPACGPCVRAGRRAHLRCARPRLAVYRRPGVSLWVPAR